MLHCPLVMTVKLHMSAVKESHPSLRLNLTHYMVIHLKIKAIKYFRFPILICLCPQGPNYLSKRSHFRGRGRKWASNGIFRPAASDGFSCSWRESAGCKNNSPEIKTDGHPGGFTEPKPKRRTFTGTCNQVLSGHSAT